MTDDVIDAEVIHDHGTELATRDPGDVNLFRTDDPLEVLPKATAVADQLKALVDRQGLIARIRGKEHPLVEAWQTLGSMLGVTAVCVHTEALKDRHGKPAYLATVEARFRGEVVGRADAMCSTSESRWSSADDYALLSMAQTRATSKALKGPLGWVMKIAGYSSTPAEEMPDEPPTQQQQDPTPRPVTIDPARAVEIEDKIREKGLKLGDARALLALEYGDQTREWNAPEIALGIAHLSPAAASALEQELG